jgi:DNA-binding CsgD family transcriptional regulator
MHVHELASFTEIQHTTVFLFSGYFEQKERNSIEKLRNNNRIHHFYIRTDINEPFLPFEPDETVLLDTPMEKVRAMVSSALEKDGTAGVKSVHGDLTVREKDVLSLVARGHSNKEIADKLFISVHTVISHRKNVTEKLGIKSISGLTVYAMLNKIIDPDQIGMDELI